MLERAKSQLLGDTAAPMIFLMLFGVGIYFVARKSFGNLEGDFRNNLKKLINPILFVTLGLLTLVFLSAGLRWTFRSWYFIPLLIPFFIFTTLTVGEILKSFTPPVRQGEWKTFFMVFLILGISFSYFITYEKNLKDSQILQKTMYEAALWQNENLPEGSSIGVFNAGIQAYFSKHKVVNLDGLINNQASKAMLENTLWQYATEVERLDYISDFDSYMTYRYKDSLRGKDGELLNITASTTMDKIHTVPGPKDLNIYKIIYPVENTQ